MIPSSANIQLLSEINTNSFSTEPTKTFLNKPLEPNLDKLMGYLKAVNERAWYTNFGPLHDLLSERLSNYFKVKNLLLVNNATTALQIAAKVLKCQSAWTTPYSFAATSSSLSWQGIPLHYSDIDPKSLNPNLELMEESLSKNPQINMLLPTHIYGNPCNVNDISALAKRRNVKVLYDAAQCFGVTYEGKSILEFGDASVVSFHATKLFHTVEGGAICFKNEQDFTLAKQMLNFGFDGEQLGASGINGKMNEYQAAVGLTLLDDIDQVLTNRINLFNRYRSHLEGMVELQQWSSKATYNGGYFPLILPSAFHCKKLIMALAKQNIQSRIYFKEALHHRYGKGELCHETDSIIPRVLTLPLHHYMTLKEVDRICEIVIKNV
jgi:dTDP-4-amino-4,6-dideoxygalactose transaminase